MTALVYIGLGSNLGNRSSHILRGCKNIDLLDSCRLIQMSSIYETPPMGPQNQADFLNAVCSVHCNVEPLVLLEALKAIEREHGRVASKERWTARPLDLDILLYGQRQVLSSRLCIPHAGITDRSFVLWPLAELDPDLVIPGRGVVSDWRQYCEPAGIRKLA